MRPLPGTIVAFLVALFLALLAPLGVARQDPPGRSLHLTLRPSSADAELPSGLRVAVWFTRDGAACGRTELRTGEHGASELELALPAELARPEAGERLAVHAELVEPGWQRHDQLAFFVRGAARVEIRNFAFLRGGTLEGTLRLGAGDAGAKLEVYLVPAGARVPDASRIALWNRWVGPAQRPFRLHFSSAGRYRLLARCEGVGSAVVEELELAPGTPHDPLQLELRGTGRIAGRFVDPHGAPQRAHPVWAAPRRLSEREEVDECATRAVPVEERGDGLHWSVALTDDEGRFRLEGLAPGEYWLYSGAPHEGGSTLLLPRPVGCGGADVELVGGPRRLVLRVVDDEGQPVQPRRNRIDIDEPGDALLECVRCAPGERPNPWTNTPRSLDSQPGRASQVFLVEPGERYVYAFVSRESPVLEGEITIGASDFECVRELRLPARAPAPAAGDAKAGADTLAGWTGELALALTRPDGEALAHDFQVELDSLETGLELFHSRRDTSGSAYEERLPSGRYRLRVRTEDSVPECGTGWTPAPAPFGEWTSEVEIRRGQRTHVDVRFWRGGKLRLELALPPQAASQEARWRELYPTRTSPPQAGWLELGARGPAAVVTLRADPAGSALVREPGMREPGEPLEFGLRGLYRHYHYAGILPGDEEETHDWIPPGDYLLHVESREFATAEARITIRADETRALRVQLVPR